MEPSNNSLEQEPDSSAIGSSLEEQPVAAPTTSAAPAPPPASKPNPMSGFRRHKKAGFSVTVAAASLIILIGGGGLLLSSLHGSKKPAQSATAMPKADNYAVSNLSVQGVKASQALQVGDADHLVINGQLQVSSGLVISPTSTPTSPTVGQIYYDKTANAPYYYNGSQFISLAPTSTSQGVISVGGVGGALSLGAGININNDTLSNNGVISITGTANQLNTSSSNGNVTLSLPQDIATTSTPTFGGETLNGNLTVTSGTTTIDGATVLNGAVTIQSASAIIGTASQQGSLILNAGNTAIGTLQTSDNLAQNTTYILPDPGSGTATICLSTGNCTGGVGAGVGTLGGTPNVIPLFTGTSEIGNSILSQDSGATTVTVSGALSVTGAISGNGSGLTNLDADNINTGVLAVSNGGTGATDAADALTNLGAAASGINSDITSLTDISSLTPSSSLTIGSTTEPLSLQGSDATTFSVADSGFTTTLEFAQPTADASIVIPNTSGTVAVQASGPLQLSSGGVLSCTDCLVSNNSGGGILGVTSVNTFTGAVTLDAGVGLSVTNNSGTITVAADQDISTTATPTFGGLTLNGALGVGVSVPQYTVDVNGDVNVSGAFRINGVTICTSGGCTSGGGSGSYIQNGTTTQTANFAIEGASGSNSVAIIKGALGQSANIFAVQNSIGTSQLSVAPNGDVGVDTASPGFPLDVNGDINTNESLSISGTAVCSSASGCTPVASSPYYIQNGTSLQTSANFAVQSAAVGDIGGVIRGASGQTADLLQIQANAGTELFGVGSSGNGYLAGTLGIGTMSPGFTLDVQGTGANGTINAATALYVGGNEVCTSAGCLANGGSGSYIQNSTTVQTSANIAIQSQADSSVGELIRAHSNTQTADLLDIQNAASSNLFSVTSAGTAKVATSLVVGTVTSPTYTVEVGGDVNLASATAAYRIDGIAVCSLSGCAASGGSGNYIQNTTTLETENFSIQSAAATNSPTAVIQQASGQTGDLLDFNTSGGSVAAAVNASGQLRVGAATAYTSVLNVGTNTTNALGGVTFGTDTDLYRSASGTLKTDGTLQAATFQESGADFATGLQLQSTTASSTRSTNLTFTDNESTPQSISLRKQGNNLVVLDNSGNVQLGFSPSTDGILFGTSLDTDLYRSGTDALTTDGALTVAGNFTSNGTTLFKNTTNSTTAFTIQNALGTNVLVADTADQRVGIDTITPPSYALDVNGDINTDGVYRVDGNPICNSAGCTAASGSGYYIQNGIAVQTGNFFIQSALATDVGGVIQGASSQSADLLDFQNSTGTVLADIDSNGDINTTGMFEVGGTQIASINLSDNANLAKLNGTGPQVFTGNNEFTGSGNGSTTYGTLFQNATNSTTAFAVQNAAGTSALSINTSSLTTTVQAGTSTATLGPNLTPDQNMNDSNWTSTGWNTTAVTSATNNSGNTAALSTSQFTPTSGTQYEVSFTFSGTITSGTTVAVALGGSTVANYTFTSVGQEENFTDTRIVTAANSTSPLTFTPSSNFLGTISAVSVQTITPTPATLVVNNASGTANIQVTASSSTTNDFIGLNSGSLNSTGIDDVALGTSALQGNTTGTVNTAIGYNALQANTSGTLNTALGANALAASATGYANTAVGANALADDTFGADDVALGTSALRNNTSGSVNTALGVNALGNNVSGTANTAVGEDALDLNNTGSDNTALGQLALQGDISASNDTGVGFEALQVGTGGSNTAIGSLSLLDVTTGSSNVALGSNTGRTNTTANATTTGSGNTFIGTNSGQGQAIYQTSNSTTLGQDSTVNQSNAVILGCTNGVNSCTATSTVGIGSQYAPNSLTVSPSTYGTNGTAGTTSHIAESGTTGVITGTGTTFTSGMVGGTIYYSDGTTGTISTFSNTTSLTASVAKAVTAGAAYTIVYGGFNVTSTGTAYLQPTSDSTTAFQIQNAAGTTTLFDADTGNLAIGIDGASTTAGYALNVTGSINASTGIYSNGIQVCTTSACAASSSQTAFIDNGTTLQTANFNIQSASITSPIAVLEEASGQTSDALQVLSSAGVLIGRITNAGSFASNIIYVGEGGGNGSLSNHGTGSGTLLTNGSAAAVDLAVQGATSQSADLLDLENSSGSVLSGFTSAGALQGGNASGSNTAGTALALNGGQGTGTGVGGNITFGIAKAGSSGSSLNSEATVATISGTTGAVTLQNSTNSGSALLVQNTGGSSVFDVSTSTSEIGVGTSGPTQAISLAQNDSIATFLFNPAAPTLTPSSSGGSLASGIYYYKVTALDAAGGETNIAAGGNEASTTVTGPIGSVLVSWTASPSAVSYRIYRGTSSGGENVYYSVSGGSTTSFTDTGATGASGSGVSSTSAYVNKIAANGNSWFDGGDVGIGTAAPGNLLSIGALTTAASTYQIAVSTGGTSNSGIVVQTVASQSSGYILQAQNSSGATLASIDYQGNLSVKAATINGTLTVNGHVITGNSSGTTSAAGQAGLGTGGSPSCSVTGDDTGGRITITDGTTGMSTGAECIITFANSYSPSTPNPVIAPSSSNDGSISAYVSASSTTFMVNFTTAGAANATYTFNYFNAQ